ncbi:DUF3180 domain-containing protein [Luteipulveratus sp. YIM 133132]|uniref:DUF3180 domain-containing protein n=1 Tax=Luteipulveratus flavus TaxID=3031728 RepID=A0ABT6C789_9MICO|nr:MULTISPECIES: DUF3180 domain-containing protein [unclassified Luteipulveratus]MDE9364940.1 DUF3180 domain-containing protein [Luteipulveratus sp. YIM 133132]MDF8264720.1 DUF3180 domain-containing protein [Luteipulveratus sp. YIM 133296]
MNHDGLTWKHATTAAAVVLVPAYAGLRLWSESGHTPPRNSWFAVAIILLMASAILAAAREIRRYVKGDSKFVLTPQRARRTVVGSQATIIGGGAAAGWYLAQAFVHLPNADVDSVRSALVLAAVLFVASAGLAVAGLVAQSWCKNPPEDEDSERDPRGPAAA